MVEDLNNERFILLISLLSVPKVISSSSINFSHWKLSFKTCIQRFTRFSLWFPSASSVFSYVPYAHFQPFSLENREWEDGSLEIQSVFHSERGSVSQSQLLFYAHHKRNLENLVTWHCLIWIKALILLLFCDILCSLRPGVIKLA